ncbi:thiol-disulfide oxidoreductase DCC family protein [Paenibacillus sp.]|uniref:thiol-disulfide oxidoreductase DCC family protein n=1 Tax=Paenibacillus sp. TaxID=58172 RepID=UPI002D4F6EB8|nr:thiol-disulfide oxidoreductase DCC family protein [Paenibacillus sp.]HZG55934.1 thiol-disulfide oxidoreductase DCC family protein [Paenibacillus sp.]
MSGNETGIVLYDGDCNLCAAVVQFAIVRDRSGALRFAALQSETGRRLLDTHGLARTATDTFVYVERGKAYVRSTAALRLVLRLRGGWPLLSALLAVPSVLRDPVYTFVARRRYRWFGKREVCMLMKPEYRERFLP